MMAAILTGCSISFAEDLEIDNLQTHRDIQETNPITAQYVSTGA